MFYYNFFSAKLSFLRVVIFAAAQNVAKAYINAQCVVLLSFNDFKFIIPNWVIIKNSFTTRLRIPVNSSCACCGRHISVPLALGGNAFVII